MCICRRAAPDIPPLLDSRNSREWLDRQLQKYEFIIRLYYRAVVNPVASSYEAMLNPVYCRKFIRLAARCLALRANRNTCSKTRWETGFPIVGDPHQELRELCTERGSVDVFYNEDYDCGSVNGHLIQRVVINPRCWPFIKPGGFSNAGVVCPRNILWWPTGSDCTWEMMQAQMDNTEDAGKIEMGSATANWPRYLFMLTAHGWFIRPKAFPLARRVTAKVQGREAAVTVSCTLARAFYRIAHRVALYWLGSRYRHRACRDPWLNSRMDPY